MFDLNERPGGGPAGQPALHAASHAPGAADPLGALWLDLASEVAISGAISLDASAFGRMHVCGGTTADYTVTLPPVAGNAGKVLGVRIAGACTKLVTLDGAGSEAIDGAATRVLWAGESAVLLCDGAGWVKIAGKTIPMMCKLSANATQSIPTTAVATSRMDVAIFDVGGLADIANNRLVVKRAGVYNVFGHMSLSTADLFFYAIAGATSIVSEFAGASSGRIFPLAGSLQVASGGLIYLNVYQETGSTKITGSTPYPCISIEEIPQW